MIKILDDKKYFKKIKKKTKNKNGFLVHCNTIIYQNGIHHSFKSLISFMVNSILKVNVIDFPIIYESNKSDIYYLNIYSITFQQKKLIIVTT